MWKHCVGFHSSEEQPFTIKIVQKHSSAFARQIQEAVKITNGARDHNMNSKKEFLGESLPRLTIEVRDKVVQLDHDGSRMSPLPYNEAGKRVMESTTAPLPKRYKTQVPNKTSPAGDRDRCKGDLWGAEW